MAHSMTLDGPVYRRPIVDGDTVIAATGNDSVYAIAGGDIRWRTHLADPAADLPCGDIDLVGVTGRPAYDAAAQRLYAMPR
ncbi:hypothetical protein ACWEP5_03795 [Nocardia niigatensis]